MPSVYSVYESIKAAIEPLGVEAEIDHVSDSLLVKRGEFGFVITGNFFRDHTAEQAVETAKELAMELVQTVKDVEAGILDRTTFAL
jgi:hypothetical protein